MPQLRVLLAACALTTACNQADGQQTSGSAAAQTAPRAGTTEGPGIPDSSGLDTDVFRSAYVGQDGDRLHYVRGGPAPGQGEGTILLIPGWPETWYAWRKMMPALAERYDVIAIDPPGLGASDLTPNDYDTGAVSDRLSEAMATLGVTPPYHVVAHDVGTWIAYTHAQRHADEVQSLVLMDAAVPGLNLEEAFTLQNAPRLFQFFFNAVEDLPEELTEGREREFLTFFFDTKSIVKDAITEDDVEVYLDTYTQPERMSAGFAYYRAVPQDSQENQSARFAMPILALGAQSGVKDGLVEALQQGPAPQAQGGEVIGCGHYMPEECPADLLDRITAFYAQ